MIAVTITTDGFGADASVIAMAFGIDPATLQARMRAGQVTVTCEAGVNADLGRFRLTFGHAGRALRLTVNSDGEVRRGRCFPSLWPRPFAPDWPVKGNGFGTVHRTKSLDLVGIRRAMIQA